jgi:hypothetical protein
LIDEFYLIAEYCRAGAVEQLRTHTRRLNSLHLPEENGNREMVQLYEKGYGKVRPVLLQI